MTIGHLVVFKKKLGQIGISDKAIWYVVYNITETAMIWNCKTSGGLGKTTSPFLKGNPQMAHLLEEIKQMG